jgi:hypothetical protein
MSSLFWLYFGICVLLAGLGATPYALSIFTGLAFCLNVLVINRFVKIPSGHFVVFTTPFRKPKSVQGPALLFKAPFTTFYSHAKTCEWPDCLLKMKGEYCYFHDLYKVCGANCTHIWSTTKPKAFPKEDDNGNNNNLSTSPEVVQSAASTSTTRCRNKNKGKEEEAAEVMEEVATPCLQKACIPETRYLRVEWTVKDPLEYALLEKPIETIIHNKLCTLNGKKSPEVVWSLQEELDKCVSITRCDNPVVAPGQIRLRTFCPTCIENSCDAKLVLSVARIIALSRKLGIPDSISSELVKGMARPSPAAIFDMPLDTA